AAPAQQDAALGPFFAQGSTDGLRIVGIVYWIGAVGAEVKDLAVRRGQESLHRLLESESGMIRSYRDAHRSPRSRDLVLRRRDDVRGGEAELLLQFLERRRGAERLHADAVPAPADILRPAEVGPLFHGDPRGDRFWQHLLVILGVIATVMLKHLP